MKRLLALLAGGLGLQAYLRHRRGAREAVSSPADELRTRLAESRMAPVPPVEEPAVPLEPTAAGEPVAPVDEAEDTAARRAAVHARARNAIDELRD